MRLELDEGEMQNARLESSRGDAHGLGLLGGPFSKTGKVLRRLFPYALVVGLHGELGSDRRSGRRGDAKWRVGLSSDRRSGRRGDAKWRVGLRGCLGGLLTFRNARAFRIGALLVVCHGDEIGSGWYPDFAFDTSNFKQRLALLVDHSH